MIYEVDESDYHLKMVGCLDEITEGRFWRERIDSLFFINRDTIAVTISTKIYLIEWREGRILKCVQIEGLHRPLLSKGVRKGDCFTTFWYNRRTGIIRFSVGALTVDKEIDSCINRYSTDPDLLTIRFYYSGWFPDKEILQTVEGVDAGSLDSEIDRKELAKEDLASSDTIFMDTEESGLFNQTSRSTEASELKGI